MASKSFLLLCVGLFLGFSVTPLPPVFRRIRQPPARHHRHDGDPHAPRGTPVQTLISRLGAPVATPSPAAPRRATRQPLQCGPAVRRPRALCAIRNRVGSTKKAGGIWTRKRHRAPRQRSGLPYCPDACPLRHDLLASGRPRRVGRISRHAAASDNDPLQQARHFRRGSRIPLR